MDLFLRMTGRPQTRVDRGVSYTTVVAGNGSKLSRECVFLSTSVDDGDGAWSIGTFTQLSPGPDKPQDPSVRNIGSGRLISFIESLRKSVPLVPIVGSCLYRRVLVHVIHDLDESREDYFPFPFNLNERVNATFT